MNIKFDHKSENFQDAIICEGKTLSEHFHVNPDFLLEDTMDKIGEKLDKRTLTLVETIKTINEEVKNLSLFVTCCYLFAETVLRRNAIIKIVIAKRMTAAMKGEESLSVMIEELYNQNVSNEDTKDDEVIILGLLAFQAGFINVVLREYMDFHEKMLHSKLNKEKAIGSELDNLLKILKRVSDAIEEKEGKKPDPPPLSKLKDLDSPDKKN